MREAMKLADTIAVLDGGKLVLQTSTADLRDRYPDLEAEQLLLTLLEQVA